MPYIRTSLLYIPHKSQIGTPLIVSNLLRSLANNTFLQVNSHFPQKKNTVKWDGRKHKKM